MKDFNVPLFFKDAKFADLTKLIAAYALDSQGKKIPGLNSLIGTAEKYIKKIIGGWPAECKLSFEHDGISFKPTWQSRLMYDGIDQLKIPYKDINNVQCIKESWLTALY